MSNALSDDTKATSYRMGKMGWALRRIEQATEVRPETASACLKPEGLKGAGVEVGPPGNWGGGLRQNRPTTSALARSSPSPLD